MAIGKWITERLREPSTYAGIASLVGLFGITLDPGLVQQIAVAGGGIAGLLAILLKDKSF